MAIVSNFKIFILTIVFLLLNPTTFVYAQKRSQRTKGFQFNVNTLAMIVTDKNDKDLVTTEPDKVYLDRDTRLFGVNFEAHYRFDEYLIVGLGAGYERIINPDISYIPFYISLRSSIGGEKLEAPIFRLDIGTHFGDLARNGALLRIGVGYRLPVYKMFCINLEGIITYQGIRKEFDVYPGVIQQYNMVGMGIGLGFEL